MVPQMCGVVVAVAGPTALTRLTFSYGQANDSIGIALSPYLLVLVVLIVLAAQAFYLDRVAIRTGRSADQPSDT